MVIEQINLNEITEYEKNAKKHDEIQIKNVMESIKEFGMVQPIVVDKNNVIIIGHCRFKALQKLNWQEVPALRLEDLTESEVNKLRLLDNKLNESEWDFDLLSDQIGAIDWNNFDIDWGLDDFLKEDEKLEIIEDEAPDVEDTSISQVGDIYILGKHRLICGDSTDVSVIDKLMDGEKADMVLSDPPYGMNLDTDFSTIKGSMKSLGRKNHTEGNKYEKVIGDNEDFKPELITTFFANFDYVKEMFLFGADYFAELLPDKNKGSWLVWDKRKESQADAIGSEFELIWSRNKHKRRMLRHDWFGFLSSENGADARNRVHPTQKPITLLVDILNQWGKDANVIVDLYGGSGSTLIACEQLNRKCYMCEISPNYVDVIIQRYINFKGSDENVFLIRDGKKIPYSEVIEWQEGEALQKIG